MFLLVLAHLGSPGQRAVKRWLLLLLSHILSSMHFVLQMSHRFFSGHLLYPSVHHAFIPGLILASFTNIFHTAGLCNFTAGTLTRFFVPISGSMFRTWPFLYVTGFLAQGGHKSEKTWKPGILREFSEPGILMEFSGNSVQPHNFSTFKYLRKTTVDSVNSIIMISESSEPVH